MVEFRTDKEILQIMGNCVDFVSELIDYIAEYPDDDYMTMECLCRKLHKYGLVDKKDGFYLVADDTLRKIEPNSSEKPNNCETCKHNKLEWYSEVCDGCSKAHSNYEPQTETQTETQNSNLTFEKSDCPWK